jgi:hypothetical protein
MSNNTNINNHYKSVVNEIKKKYGNSSIINNNASSLNNNSNTNDSNINKIAVKIKNHLSSNLKYWVFIVLPVLIILLYLLYQYNLGSRSRYVISKMDYKDKLENKPLLQCYQQDIKYQFKLCDYYISSSFMTPCIGNQHYDYISTDMIIEVLQSGARYIQIPICENDITEKSLPVVATAEYGQQLITSLNVLDIASVFKAIRGNAFKLNNTKVNYPLIIHLILNTKKKFTLDVVADNIQEIFGDVLVEKSKYTTHSVFLEKLCNLLGKIIIIATPEYLGTKMENFITPTTKLFNIYHFGELAQLNLPSDTIFENSYNKKLSMKEQARSYKLFKEKYPSLEYVKENSDSIGETILNDKEILNNLTSFNKIGVSIVKPHKTEDVETKNYDTTEALFMGCQFITMNFQINDAYMKNYLEIFKESSFRLKPSSMRFTEEEIPQRDYLSIYEKILEKNENILNNYYYKYNNKPISFESYNNQTTYLTQIENYLKFRLGTDQEKDKFGVRSYNIGINQCFIIRKSTIGGSEDISFYLESAAQPGLYITLNNNIFHMERLSKNKKGLVNQAFYFEKPKISDDELSENVNKGDMISIRSFSNDKVLYLANENKNVKAYSDAPQIQARNNMTFFVKSINYEMVIKIITLYDGSLKTINGNIIGVLENNTSDGTSYVVIPTSQNKDSFNIFKDQFMLKNKEKGTYVIFDVNTGLLYDRNLEPNTLGIFNIIAEKGYYTISNVNNDQLILFNRNLVKFTNKKNIISNENMFKLDISYDLLK